MTQQSWISRAGCFGFFHVCPDITACIGASYARNGGGTLLTVFVRACILFAAAVLAMRVMGKRQVGQLQPFELVVAIMIAELAATPLGDVGIPLLYGILPMAALVVCHGLIAGLCMRSVRFRALISGQPTVLIRSGVICEKELRRMSMTLDDLMEGIRTGGYLDPAEVGTALLETSGVITVFPKSNARPVTTHDLGIEPPSEGMPLPLIMDGRVHRENLHRGELSEEWLQVQLTKLGYRSAKEVLFLCVCTSGMLLAQGKGSKQTQQLQALRPEEVRW